MRRDELIILQYDLERCLRMIQEVEPYAGKAKHNHIYHVYKRRALAIRERIKEIKSGA